MSRVSELPEESLAVPPGSRAAVSAESLLSQCYGEMRRIARRVLGSEGEKLVIQPTELANEAAIRLIQARNLSVGEQGHMLALAARTMRRVMIDEVRRARASKRQMPPMLTEWPGAEQGGRLVDLEDLDRALDALERFSPEHARIVELRFSLGMTVIEAAQAMDMPERTLKRRWQSARTWLIDYLDNGDGSSAARH